MTVKRAVASMAIATIASRIFGFVRIIVIAALLGTTALGNTFQSTNAISNVLFDLLAAGALSAAIVPQLVRAMSRSERELKELVSSLVTLVLIILGSISIAGVVLAGPIAEALFSRAPISTRADQIELGTVLLRFFIPQVVLYGLGALAVAALTAKKKFIAQVIAPIGGSIFIMAAVGLFRYLNDGSSLDLSMRDTWILGLAGTGACIAFVALPIVFALRNGFSMLPNLNLKQGLEALSSSVWAVAIQASAAILLAMTIFVGNKTNGAVVAYQLAFVFFLAPYAIISQSFSTVLLPDLSLTAMKEKENKDFHKIVSNMMTWTYRPMIVATAFCLPLSVPLTNLVSQGRAGSGQNLVETAFIALVLGIVPYSVFQATSRIYFAKSEIKLPALSILFSSLVLSLAATIGSQHVSGVKLLWVMGLTHTLAYALAGGYLLLRLHLEKYKVFPDPMTWIMFLIATIYAVTGMVITNVYELNGRFESVVYILGFVVVNVVVVATILPSDKRSSYLTTARQSLRKTKV